MKKDYLTFSIILNCVLLFSTLVLYSCNNINDSERKYLITVFEQMYKDQLKYRK